MRYLYLLLLMCSCIGISFAQPQLQLEPFANGFSNPVDITNASDDRLFVVERAGVIRILNADGSVRDTAFLNINSRVSNSGGERGLLGLAFHPDYANNGYFFVNYIDNGGETVVARYSVSSGNPNVADPFTELLVLYQTQPYSNHNGGDLAFGPDGYLYIGLGDGGSGGDPGNRSQNKATLLGKMLRLNIDSFDVNAEFAYSIPADNPFVNDALALDEIWATGLRNPWRYSFDRLTGDLWIADVGQNKFEEVNKEIAGGPGGYNYGWRCFEGFDTFDFTCDNFGNDSLLFPVFAYAQGNLGCSVTGGYVYRGAAFPGMYGYYFYADYCSDRIFALRQNIDDEWVNHPLINESNIGFSTFGEDQNGELYVAGLSSGVVYRLTDACGNFDLTLNGTDESCPDSLDGFISNIIMDGSSPYTLEWSNGATSNTISDLGAGDYALTLTDTEGCELIREVTINNDAPDAPLILTTTDSLEIEDSYVTYRWFRDGEEIGGVDKSSIIPVVSGAYSVEVTNTSGCSQTFFIADVVIINSAEELQLDLFRLSPNPTKDLLNISGLTTDNGRYRLQVFNNTGQALWTKEVDWSGHFTALLNLSHLPSGAYYLRIDKDRKAFTRSFQIQ